MNRKVIAGVAVAAFVGLASFLVARPGSGQPVVPGETKKQTVSGTLNASGVGAVDVTADTAHVPLSLTARAKDRPAAVESLNTQQEKLVSALKKRGFDQIHVGYTTITGGATGEPVAGGMMGMIGGEPQPDPNANAKSPIVGYLRLTVVVQKADDYPGLVKSINAVKTVAAENGGAPVGINMSPYIGYSTQGVVLSNSKESDAYARARVAALRDSAQNAKHLAKEAGITLRGIIAVSEPAATISGTPLNGIGMQYFGGMGMMGMGGMMMGGMPMSAYDHVTGQRKIMMNVSVTYGH